MFRIPGSGSTVVYSIPFILTRVLQKKNSFRKKWTPTYELLN